MSWSSATLGEVSQLVYGKALQGYTADPGNQFSARVFGTNGPIGWAKAALTDSPTIIVGRKGAYRGIHFSEGPSWTIDTAFYTEVDSERVDLKWLYYRLLLVDINGMNSGAAIPSTRREDFYSIRIKLPELDSQRRIASILSTYDDLIENNRRRIVLLEESARLLYREWFVHLRYPGHEHVRIIDGTPEGWERRKLGSILTLKRGYDLPEVERVPGSFPIVSSSGITGFHNHSKAVGPGVVTGRYGTLGEVYYIEGDYWPLNTALYVLDYKGHHPLMVFHLLKLLLKGIITEKAAVPGVDRNVLHTMPVTWPPRRLQDAFVEIVREYQDQLRVLKEMNQKLAQTHDLLLPRLMSGEIAV
jgi:type I restriction enzyme, S subunit